MTCFSVAFVLFVDGGAGEEEFAREEEPSSSRRRSVDEKVGAAVDEQDKGDREGSHEPPER